VAFPSALRLKCSSASGTHHAHETKTQLSTNLSLKHENDPLVLYDPAKIPKKIIDTKKKRPKTFETSEMVDVASITVSVVSLVTAIGVAVATGVLQIYSEERNARRETERLLRKYRDPLLLGECRGLLYNKKFRSFTINHLQLHKISNRGYTT